MLLYNGLCNTSKTRIITLIRKQGNIPSLLKNCIFWTKRAWRLSLKEVNPFICWNLTWQVICFRKRKQTKKRNKNRKCISREVTTRQGYQAWRYWSLHRKTSLALKITFAHFWDSKEFKSLVFKEYKYGECFQYFIHWQTTLLKNLGTTKKFVRRARAVKLLTMSCHIKVRHSFLVNSRRIWTSVKV